MPSPLCRGHFESVPWTHRFFTLCFATFLATMLTGCIKVNDTLTINPDGSGSIVLKGEVAVGTPNSMIRNPNFNQQIPSSPLLNYPPHKDYMVNVLFPSDIFTQQKCEITADENKTSFSVHVTFTDINALLKSPYAEIHSLRISKSERNIECLSRSSLALLQLMKNNALKKSAMESGNMTATEANALLQKDAIHVSFSIVMKEAPLESNGVIAGNQAEWSVNSKEGFDQAMAALNTTRSARWPKEALTITPVNPIRLNLASFQQLEEKEYAFGKAVDEQARIKGIRILPYILQSQLSYAYQSNYFSGSNNTTLMFFLIEDKSLNIQHLNKPVINEARDNVGSDLVMKADQDSNDSYDYPPNKEILPDGRKLYQLSVTLRPPAFHASSLPICRGTIPAVFESTNTVIKCSSILQKDQIKKGSLRYSGREPIGIPLEHPMLRNAAVDISLTASSPESGIIQIEFNNGERQDSISSAQFFSADGSPCPTLAMTTPYENESAKYLLPADVTFPLSLALVIRTDAKSVDIPFTFTNLPLTTPPSSTKTTSAESKENP